MIRIITTGGTFDKKYDEIKGELTFRESQLPTIIKDARLPYSVSLEGPIAIDSLYMSQKEREMILSRIKEAKEERILIIHGTDTMAETAELVLSDPVAKEKTVVFTGAMIPYSLEHSDATFNFAFAFSGSLLLSPGVYIAMNGKFFEAGKVRKDKEKGVFVEK